EYPIKSRLHYTGQLEGTREDGRHQDYVRRLLRRPARHRRDGARIAIDRVDPAAWPEQRHEGARERAVAGTEVGPRARALGDRPGDESDGLARVQVANLTLGLPE